MNFATQGMALQQALTPHGLRLRGSWQPSPADAPALLPLLALAPCLQTSPSSPPAQVQPGLALHLVGVVGSEFWPHFKASPFYADGHPDPLDRWSRHIGDALAHAYQGLALYPFDGPPWHPFQQWADRCEPTQPSRMMLRIHPAYGLWHAYRFALLLPADSPPAEPTHSAQPTQPAQPSTPLAATTDLCAACADQPCLQACPVGAYTGSQFALDACAEHLHGPRGARCMEQGCQARLACPVGAAYRYAPEHAGFHMQAFADRHGNRL